MVQERHDGRTTCSTRLSHARFWRQAADRPLQPGRCQSFRSPQLNHAHLPAFGPTVEQSVWLDRKLDARTPLRAPGVVLGRSLPSTVSILRESCPFVPGIFCKGQYFDVSLFGTYRIFTVRNSTRASWDTRYHNIHCMRPGKVSLSSVFLTVTVLLSLEHSGGTSPSASVDDLVFYETLTLDGFQSPTVCRMAFNTSLLGCPPKRNVSYCT